MASFPTLPLTIYDHILQYVAVCLTSRLRALQKDAAKLFFRRYVPNFFVALSRPMRLGGVLRRSATFGASLDASLTSETLVVPVDVPIDFAALDSERPLPQRLYQTLPGPREMWLPGASIVGFCNKKSRGTFLELQRGMVACISSDSLQYVSLTDGRLPRHIPREIFSLRPGLKVLHYEGAPDADFLEQLPLYKHVPTALCFHRSCVCFLAWAKRNPATARYVECLGDVILTPHGLQGGWAIDVAPPTPFVKQLGLAITTRRHSGHHQTWTAEGVAAILLSTFPYLETVGLNLEISCQSDVNHQKTIMKLLHTLSRARIRLFSFEVFLIQLPSSPKKRDARLESLQEDLQTAGVEMMRAPQTRTAKGVPNDGFEIPAALALSTPAVVSRAVSAALWDVVW